MTNKANRRTLGRMFAPYCPTCNSRRLLGVTRIVRTDWEQGGGIHLLCTCGTVLDAEAEPPERQDLSAA